MVKQEILDVHGLPVKVELTISSRMAKRFTYCFGIINMQVSRFTTKKAIVDRIERGLKKEDISKLDPEPLISEDFSYVFGQLTRTYKKPGKELSPSNVYVIQNNKKVTLKKLLEDYINVKCKNFESMMGLGSHVIHVKHLRAILGNNYTKRHVLNFNEKLIHFSMELIDSVILHELCHDYEANHSKRFYDLLNHYCPNYQAKRQKLVYGVKRWK